MYKIFTLLFVLLSFHSIGQVSIKGSLQDDKNEIVSFANVILYSAIDSSMIKVETSDDKGAFSFGTIKNGDYFLNVTFVGHPDLAVSDINYNGEIVDLGVLVFKEQSVELDQVTVSAYRSMVEVKADRTVFNVEGTVNSAGSDAMSLLRKAPSVTVDNNDNVTVLGRTGVLIYIDGKKLPLSGDDLSNYLKNITAEQIDRIDIITNPGAKYEAQGNAGIIDIRLKKDKSLGANGTLSGSYSKGELERFNLSGTGNYRNKSFNLFGVIGGGNNDNFHNILYQSYQNGLFLDEINDSYMNRNFYNYRIGLDYFINKNSTIGVLYNGRTGFGVNEGYNRIAISDQNTIETIDSVLIASNEDEYTRKMNSFNVNYSFNTKMNTLNIDFDYGNYDNTNLGYQPNQYFKSNETDLLSEKNLWFDTPINIAIYTAKVDFEREFYGGKLGLGVKYSNVETANKFHVFTDTKDSFDDEKSNLFDYNEEVYAGYVSYNRAINKKWNMTSGVRFEQTEVLGVLTAYRFDLTQPPVKLSYPQWFPNVGFTYTKSPMQVFSLNYGRRINRPDYNVLNPFNSQKSELSFSKGNPFLKPEIVNNLEFGFTYAYRFNFKLAYSRTIDQITRIIGPDENDPRAGFISWDNLATQTVIGFNASLPFQVKKWWSAYFNLSASHIDNQADYGDGATIDLQVFTYTIFQQHTINLPKGFKGEVSGYFAGPGVWGGVFLYDESWALNIGLQKKFFNNALNVKLTANDIFNKSGWNGISEFNGLVSNGSGRWDSRNVSLSMSYNFGNKNVKSRKRKTGLEAEGKRVK